jgi:DNA-binding CsgD family transcriptional regulator
LEERLPVKQDAASSNLAPGALEVFMSKREDIMKLVAKGKTTAEIADIMGISKWTVKYHRSPAIQKKIPDHRRRLKLKSIAYSGGQCLKCGYRTAMRSLTFHHIDPTQKEHRIAFGRSIGWKKQKIELDKTILLCQNCHGELHEDFWQPTKKMIKKQAAVRNAYIDKPLVHYSTAS